MRDVVGRMAKHQGFVAPRTTSLANDICTSVTSETGNFYSRKVYQQHHSESLRPF